MLPYKRYIIALFFLNKTVADIMSLISVRDFDIKKNDVIDVVDEYKLILPDKIKDLLKSNKAPDPEDEDIKPWLKYLKIEEIYNFLYYEGNNDSFTPLYYKWCLDAFWILEYEDVRNLVHIFLFNKEPLESISKIIKFKYKRKISQKSLKMYQEIFWDSNTLTAKNAIYIYKPFLNTTMVVRRFESGSSDINCVAEKAFDFSKNILDQDIEWVKWKVGYKDIRVPTPEEFLKKVQSDSSMMYNEVMQMKSIKEFKVIENKQIMTKDEEGNITTELVNETEVITKNPIDFKAKHMKNFTDLYIKAQDHMPSDGSTSTEKFFDRLKEIQMRYSTEYDSKIISIEDNPDVLSDILAAKGGGEGEEE